MGLRAATANGCGRHCHKRAATANGMQVEIVDQRRPSSEPAMYLGRDLHLSEFHDQELGHRLGKA